jgi:hypothetical protein
MIYISTSKLLSLLLHTTKSLCIDNHHHKPLGHCILDPGGKLGPANCGIRDATINKYHNDHFNSIKKYVLVQLST